MPKGLTAKPKGPTGELALFRKLYVKLGGKCQITHEPIAFDPWCFIHILSKGAYPSFRLKEENIFMTIPKIHDLYDNGSKEYLLSLYPKAKILYQKKEELKTEYYKPKPTI